MLDLSGCLATSVRWRSVWCHFLTAAALMCQTVAQGMAQGWYSAGESKMRDGLGPFVPTDSEASWISSIFDLGKIGGSALGWSVFVTLGRRQTLALGPAAFLAAALLTYWATSAPFLYAARFLAGLGMGVNFTFSAVYLGEVATPLGRSVLVLVITLLAPTGQLVELSIGPALDYWWLALAPLPVIALSLLLHVFCTRESPFYLAMKGRQAEAVKVLAQLRAGRSEAQIREEALAIQASVQRQLSEAQNWRQTLSPPGVKRAAVIVLIISGSPALFGVDTLLTFTKQIFEVAGSPLKSTVSSQLVIGVKVVMIIVAMYLVERLGRRVQLASAAFVNSACMAVVSVFFLLRDRLGVDVSAANWVPLAALLLFMAATGGGVIPVSHVLQGELLSQRAKMVVAPAATVLLAGTSFVISKNYEKVGNEVGYFVPFGVFALTNLCIAIFTIFVVPETRGKTLMQVQDELQQRATRNRQKEPPQEDQSGQQYAALEP